MKQPIFLRSITKNKIWGHEYWLVSSRKDEASMVSQDYGFEQIPLSLFLDKYPEYCGLDTDVFPLLVKKITTHDDLSVQVHPGDGEDDLEIFGKTECWYILDAKEGAEIVYGHTAQTKEAFKMKVEAGEWDDLLIRRRVKKGDFIYVPSGMLHAIGAGITLLEVQQNSDTTYRLYDYDRGSRDLHVDDALRVMQVPFEDPMLLRWFTMKHNIGITTYIENEYFTVQRLDVQCVGMLPEDFSINVITKGSGILTMHGLKYDIKQDDVFILPAGCPKVHVQGDLEIIRITK